MFEGLKIESKKIAPALLPEAEYVLAMTAYEGKKSEKGNPYLACVFTVQSGDSKGWKIRKSFHFANEKSKQISLDWLGALALAVGLDEGHGGDMMEMLGLMVNKDFKAKVIIRPEKDGYEAQNDIRAPKPNVDELPANMTAPKAKKSW